MYEYERCSLLRVSPAVCLGLLYEEVPTKWAALANQICQLPLFDCKVEKILTTYYVRKTIKQTKKNTF